ncbi:dopamine neurotransmitter receptor, coupled via Gs [Branchiostoma belcheri]|nr:dopamine neurotransmitter receptor, coupled via Gs [Branchiostoma belcheri]
MNGSGELANDSNGTASVPEADWVEVIPAELKATLVSLIGLGLVLGNVFVVVVILRSAALRNYTGYLTVSLACADMLPGLLVIPFSVRPAWTGHWTYGQTLCMLTAFFSCVSALASTFSLVALAVNRYILIVHAMKYQSIIGTKLCVAMIGAAWILPVLSFSTKIFEHKRYHFLRNAAHCTFDFAGPIDLACGIAFVAVLVLVVSVLHCKVYAVARRHLKNIYHYNPHATEDKSTIDDSHASLPAFDYLTSSRLCHITTSPDEVLLFINNLDTGKAHGCGTLDSSLSCNYGDVIWHGTTSEEAQLIERIQYHCALVVSGATKGSSYLSTRHELGVPRLNADVVPPEALQGAKTTAAITFAFCLTWVPYCALAVWQHMLEYPTHPDVEFALLWLFPCHGIVNVFIYSGLNRAFREQAKKLLVSLCTSVLQCLNEATGPRREDAITSPSPQARSVITGSSARTVDTTPTQTKEDIPMKELDIVRQLDIISEFGPHQTGL